MLTEIAAPEDVLQVHLETRIGRMAGFTVNLFLSRGVLIDAGFARAHRSVASLLEARRPRGALITHAHEDHAGNVALLYGRGIPVGMAPATRNALRAPEPIQFYRRWIWGTQPPLVSQTTQGAGNAFAGQKSTPVEPFADDAFVLIPTPGHSPDHHVIWDTERGHLFGGDLYLGTRVTVAYAWENPRLLEQSVRAAAALGPAILFDAHRGVIRAPTERLLAKAEWLAETIGRIDAAAAAGLPVAEIRRSVLGSETPTGRLTGGEYSRAEFVRTVLRSGSPAAGRAGEGRGA